MAGPANRSPRGLDPIRRSSAILLGPARWPLPERFVVVWRGPWILGSRFLAATARPAVATFDRTFRTTVGQTAPSGPLIDRPVGAVETALNFRPDHGTLAAYPIGKIFGFTPDTGGGSARVSLKAGGTRGTGGRRRWSDRAPTWRGGGY
jgi:hypothetical protein